MNIQDALKEIQSWLYLNGIEGVAQGEYEGKPCITVYVSLPNTETILPTVYKGFKVVIEPTEQFAIQGGPL
ncbi:hypothetical protein [Zobellia barbeyronii]|uniref:Uncharacterized protein n=1 Tax=Zobellia barbeyronii TaxID=2748009 RepID=A0ABS5WB18_9FLAO|nr:hypothetical protein [Zobellia barbeyronii]MBT2160542.1 hypothetical protein [Zobellia barbeyronii]